MIVVTGAAGFIGSCLLWKLNQEGLSDILVVDEPLTPEKKPNLEGKKFSDFVDKDKFLSLVSSNKLAKKITAIFHLGACSSTIVDDMKYFLRNNTEYSHTPSIWHQLCRFILLFLCICPIYLASKASNIK